MFAVCRKNTISHFFADQAQREKNTFHEFSQLFIEKWAIYTIATIIAYFIFAYYQLTE